MSIKNNIKRFVESLGFVSRDEIDDVMSSLHDIEDVQKTLIDENQAEDIAQTVYDRMDDNGVCPRDFAKLEDNHNALKERFDELSDNFEDLSERHAELLRLLSNAILTTEPLAFEGILDELRSKMSQLA